MSEKETIEEFKAEEATQAEIGGSRFRENLERLLNASPEQRLIVQRSDGSTFVDLPLATGLAVSGFLAFVAPAATLIGIGIGTVKKMKTTIA